MPKCLMVYFSQGGTTARVAESIAAGLHAAEYQVDLYNLQDREPVGLDGYDLLGIGSPAYYYRPPFNVTEYVRGLPELKGLPAFAFVLHGTMPGDAGNQIRETLARKGAREVGYYHCFGADFFVSYLRRGYLFSPDNPTAEEVAQAQAFGQEVAGHVSGLPYTIPPNDPAPGWIYRFERFATNRWLAKALYSRLFLVDKNKCVACGTCVQGCPTGTIGEDPEGRPIWGRDCLLCLYCEMNCPEEAITSPASWPLFAPFMKYNVRAASTDPTIDHVRVKHGQGSTQRV
jgi:flavodoxin/Pyruvate/2-oxoacid:ferredoxin oxidoreductase delta subunit